ncbi:hypothetical protein [Actinoplanes sp. L3-i22]|uniref:hypothetical protein n=1 Tax=Actinoplanes sp. L3-i22 TaxID=2836373 RepID=UPI001C74342C|nr:hypothetical protein [Actinoplanes sp. L3-i22]BCY14874.1 hypothetical protein L3i22_099620 [Actinoplanes sp. L3-i22]
MRRAGRILLIGAVVGSLGVAGTVFAYAGGWIVTGKPTRLTANVAKMPRGAEPSVAKQGSDAVVSWSAQEIAPGVRMDHYVVTAHSVDEPVQPDIARTVTAGSGPAETVVFAAAEVAGGKWRWSVVPKYRDWTGEASKPSQRLVFPALPAAQVAALPAPDPGAKAGSTAPTPGASAQSTPASGATTGPAQEEEKTSPTPAAKPDPTTPAADPGPTPPVAPADPDPAGSSAS